MKKPASTALIARLAAAAIFATTPAQALHYQEGIAGDLSDDPFTPTPLTLDAGLNLISGTMGRGPTDLLLDRDIFTFALSPGQFLTSIEVRALTANVRSFYAIAPGTSIDVNSGAAHLSNVLVEGIGEILDDLAAGSYSQDALGLAAPLPSGSYTVWFQEVGARVNYEFAYTVSVIPEPGTGLWGLGLAFATGLRRARKRGA